MVFPPHRPIRWQRRPQRPAPSEKVAECMGVVKSEQDLATKFQVYANQKMVEAMMPAHFQVPIGVDLTKLVTDDMAQKALERSQDCTNDMNYIQNFWQVFTEETDEIENLVGEVADAVRDTVRNANDWVEEEIIGAVRTVMDRNFDLSTSPFYMPR